MKKITIIGFFTLAAFVISTGCKKDFVNPNAPESDAVLNNPRALINVLIGAQRLASTTFTTNLLGANALTSGEASMINAGNVSEAQLSAGGTAVDNSNSLLGAFWANGNKIIFDAQNVLNKVGSIADKNYASGVRAYATILKAYALGSLAQFWENVPASVGTVNSTFISRNAAYASNVAAIDVALAEITANPVSAAFTVDFPAGIDLVNTLQAFKARYALFAGNYAAALSAATAVDITKVSVFNYDAAFANPIFTSITSTNNVYQPIDVQLGLPAAIAPTSGDGRVSFYTAFTAPNLRFTGFWNTNLRAIPLYLNDEMRLIRAECLLRQSTPDLPGATSLINAVLTQAPSADLNGVGANLAAYAGVNDVPSLLTEVYRNRCIELFYSGLKLEDSRRFGRPVSERKRNNFPYPIAERQNNTNTPADPPF
jgi:starch-binding outer membrane protein, SusD/RagB family